MQTTTKVRDKEMLIDENEAAKMLGLAPATLRKMRSLGPQDAGLPAIPYVKFSKKCVRYDTEELKEFINKCRVKR